jgi:hypothetical protein
MLCEFPLWLVPPEHQAIIPYDFSGATKQGPEKRITTEFFT